MSESMDRWLLTAKYSEAFEHDKWIKEIPILKFPSDWTIQIIPPFASAVIRFRAFKNGKTISVYLDCYDLLGANGEPYWEAYPVGEDTTRYDMADWQSLFREMNLEFERINEPNP